MAADGSVRSSPHIADRFEMPRSRPSHYASAEEKQFFRGDKSPRRNRSPESAGPQLDPSEFPQCFIQAFLE